MILSYGILHRTSRAGLTAVEVVVSTLLASLLMVAMLGVLRGLKAQESAIRGQMGRENWRRTLDTVLQQDLENSRGYEHSPMGLVLYGFAGRSVEGVTAWRPATVFYEVVNDGNRPWLVRREIPTVGGAGSAELVLANVVTVRMGNSTDSGLPLQRTTSVAAGREMPITDGLVVQFWGREEPVYGVQFRLP